MQDTRGSQGLKSQHWVAVIGLVMAVWMTLGRHAFGLGGSLTWWYLPTIGVGYAWLQLWAARRIRLTREKGRRTRPRSYVTQLLSWLCAIAFGFTVPDRVGDSLVSIVGAYGGPGWNEMSIALCNPFGILAFTLAIAGVAFAAADGRDPAPEEDEIESSQEMVEHPLAP